MIACSEQAVLSASYSEEAAALCSLWLFLLLLLHVLHLRCIRLLDDVCNDGLRLHVLESAAVIAGQLAHLQIALRELGDALVEAGLRQPVEQTRHAAQLIGRHHHRG
jgi:hypothetical protein